MIEKDNIMSENTNSRTNKIDLLLEEIRSLKNRIENIESNKIESKNVRSKSKSEINVDDINIEDLKSDNRNRNRRFNDDQIRKMRELRKNNVSYKKISEIFDVSTTFVRNVEMRNVYKDVE